MMITAFLFLTGCSSSKEWVLVNGQHPQSFEKEITKKVGLNFLLYLPKNYGEPAKRYPLLMFLHGSGERGKDLMKLKVHSIPKIIDTKDDFPFIVVSPQCPEGERWDAETLNALLDEIIAKLSVDTNRIYLTGLSMGGFGTWKFAAAYPERFAAIAPVCGGGTIEDTWRLKEMPVWAFHGAKDDVVLPEESERMVASLKRMGNTQTKFTLYPDANHNAWDATYANSELYEWFLQHTKK
jgi:predicted peptidase